MSCLWLADYFLRQIYDFSGIHLLCCLKECSLKQVSLLRLGRRLIPFLIHLTSNIQTHFDPPCQFRNSSFVLHRPHIFWDIQYWSWFRPPLFEAPLFWILLCPRWWISSPARNLHSRRWRRVDLGKDSKIHTCVSTSLLSSASFGSDKSYPRICCRTLDYLTLPKRNCCFTNNIN